MPRKYALDGVTYMTLSAEISSDDHRLLRICAAEDRTSLSKLVRGIVHDFLLVRYGLQQPEESFQEEVPNNL